MNVRETIAFVWSVKLDFRLLVEYSQPESSDTWQLRINLVLPVHLGTTTWLGCTKFAIIVSGTGTVTTVSLIRHLWASSLAMVIRCCCFRFLTLHSSGVLWFSSSPLIGSSLSGCIDIELNKEDAIDKEVAAEAEGAFTPIQMDIFGLYMNSKSRSRKCLLDAIKQKCLLLQMIFSPILWNCPHILFARLWLYKSYMFTFNTNQCNIW